VSAEVDHLVVVAATLDDGVRWCEETLGVTPGPGGRHDFMGTHNRLSGLSSPGFPDCYLEIIAIDPQAAAPARRRWFGLDEPALQASLQAHGPRLIHWVARTTMLDMLRWGLVASGQDVGLPVAAGRETAQGPLRWQIVLRDDGALLHGGALPTLIQWQGRHPASAMPANGLSLAAVRLYGLPDPVRELLRLRSVSFEAGTLAGLEVDLHTPRGLVTLRSEPLSKPEAP
jgi:hypothetical protein